SNLRPISLLYPIPPSLHAEANTDVLALPIFKQEEPHISPDTDAKLPPFQYVLCTPTSPAIKLHEETLTYLNQGIGGHSIIRVVFHDRRLQYTEHQQLEGWRWSRPGDRILDLDIPLSVGILDPRASPTQLNTVEFLWDPSKRVSANIQAYFTACCPATVQLLRQGGTGRLHDVHHPACFRVHCISTEFTPRKHGGEKGVPFRIQIDTFKQNESGEYTEHLHSASCQIKVFKKVSPFNNEAWNQEEKGKYLVPSASIQDVQHWLQRNRFPQYCRLLSSFSVYHAIFLEELTSFELIEKIANLYSITPQQISQIYRQGPTGIHVVVSTEKTVLDITSF
ncbi:hypothetical protein AB205_0056070, partial [Aquarana catesbeiana]